MKNNSTSYLTNTSCFYRYFTLNLLLLGFVLTCFSQSTTEVNGARYGGLSSIGIADQSVWQNLGNPAGILTTEAGWQAGVNYSSRFSLAELASKDLVASIASGKGRFGLLIHSFGYSSYTQNQFSGAYAMKLSDQLQAGIQFNYFNVSIAEGYGNFSAVTANLGVQYSFNEKISAGFMIKNPTRSKLSSELDEFVESTIGGGVRCTIAENLTILSDITKNLDMDPNFSAGLEYEPIEEWSIRAGISTINNGLSFGFGYRPGKWSIDAASMYHQVLGFSPMISLTYKNE